jgi:hypothetical protein
MRVNTIKLLAVGLGLIASLSVASAQTPAPAPAPATPVIAAPAAGGCRSCGSGAASSQSHRICSGLFIGKGTEMPIGCSCFNAQRTFAFGSCSQFYNPGNECRHCGFGFGRCHTPVGGTGSAASVPPCVYSSYTDR